MFSGQRKLRWRISRCISELPINQELTTGASETQPIILRLTISAIRSFTCSMLFLQSRDVNKELFLSALQFLSLQTSALAQGKMGNFMGVWWCLDPHLESRQSSTIIIFLDHSGAWNPHPNSIGFFDVWNHHFTGDHFTGPQAENPPLKSRPFFYWAAVERPGFGTSLMRIQFRPIHTTLKHTETIRKYVEFHVMDRFLNEAE